MAWAFREHGLHQGTGGIELVVAREQNGLDLLLGIPLGDQVAADDFQPAVALPDLLPQVRDAVTVGIGRVTGATPVAHIERQEVRG